MYIYKYVSILHPFAYKNNKCCEWGWDDAKWNERKLKVTMPQSIVIFHIFPLRWIIQCMTTIMLCYMQRMSKSKAWKFILCTFPSRWLECIVESPSVEQVGSNEKTLICSRTNGRVDSICACRKRVAGSCFQQAVEESKFLHEFCLIISLCVVQMMI